MSILTVSYSYRASNVPAISSSFCLQRRDEGALLKLGPLLGADLSPALARLGAADVLAKDQPADDRAELPQASLFGRDVRVPCS
jgi:hypothetical protein